jgi:hypothetical protein
MIHYHKQCYSWALVPVIDAILEADEELSLNLGDGRGQAAAA